MKRAIVLVLDGCGAGYAPDAPAFGDPNRPSTLRHVWDAAGGVNTPTLASLGWWRAAGVPVGSVVAGAGYGRLKPLSLGGKDSVVGHWEMMGVILDEPFPLYPQGFPAEVVEHVQAAIGREFIGNRPASGTAIIEELGPEHLRTGRPILYTSADSVFQVAAHEEVIPTDELHRLCETARGLLTPPHQVQRVIARPFTGEPGAFRRTEARRDFPVPPPLNDIDAIGDVDGIGVVPELFGGRGFRPRARTQSNAEHAIALRDALNGDARFLFANFEDFDMRFGHRNDAPGFARCLEEFDPILAETIANLRDGDLLILTADHGNDPTDPSTDHSREFVPMVTLGGPEVGSLGDRDGFAHVGRAVRGWLGV